MKRIEFISFEEFNKIFKAEKDKKMKTCLLLGYGSGLRISEIVGLRELESKCCKVDVYQKRIPEQGKTLKKFFCSKCDQEVGYDMMTRSKTKWKIPPLTSDKIDLMKHQIRLDIAKGGKWRVTVTAPNLNNSHLSLLPIHIERRTLQNRFDKLTKRVLDKKMSFHILRHGFGNYQANVLKLPLPIVQQMMGHARLDTTGIYTRVNPEYAIGEAWRAMNGDS